MRCACYSATVGNPKEATAHKEKGRRSGKNRTKTRKEASRRKKAPITQGKEDSGSQSDDTSTGDSSKEATGGDEGPLQYEQQIAFSEAAMLLDGSDGVCTCAITVTEHR